jgi:hypothetical protein
MHAEFEVTIKLIKPPAGIKTLGGFNLVPSGIPFSWFSPSFCKKTKRPTLCKKE